jgi:adenylate cyclase
MQRRLAAIVHADIAGFTRMMEGSETRTFRHLKTAQIEVWRPAIQAASGRLVGTAGDAMLAEFGSAVTAVSAALDIQERMAKFNDTIEPEQRMNFRIGVHLGEVIVDDEDQNIFGDGVNLAARIQSLAEPGGIAVSRAVRDVAKLHDDYAYVDDGEHRAKHVSRPLHIYRVRPRMSATTVQIRPTSLRKVFHFHGVDLSGGKVGFGVEVDDLVKRDQGVLIGRDSTQCDLVLLNESVSRRHARLSMGTNNILHIEDVGSTNGTSINGTPIAPGLTQALEPGSTLKLGDIELVVHYD